MAAVAGISDSSVHRLWHAAGLKPHRVESLKLNNGLNCDQKLEGIALRVEEKGLLQAFGSHTAGTNNGTQPGRLMTPSQPARNRHLIADNYSVHKYPKVEQWLKRRPRFQVHYIPTSSSWLNKVQRYFRNRRENRLLGAVFRGVLELIEAQEESIDLHNRNTQPFIWSAKANDMLARVMRAQASAHESHSE